jgi:hypothetical protein
MLGAAANAVSGADAIEPSAGVGAVPRPSVKRPPARAEARMVRTMECLLNAVLLTGMGTGDDR